MMGEVQQYLQDILDIMEEEHFFEMSFISKKTMADCLLKAMDHNLDTKGDYRLSEQDLLAVHQKALETHIADSIAEAVQEGLIEITGVAPNGELIYGLSENFQKELESESKEQVLTAKFERLGPFGTYCLN